MTALDPHALGVAGGLPFADYLREDALSCSALKCLRRSPHHFHAGDDPEAPRSDAMRRGTLLHTLTLEPDALLQRYRDKPDGMNFSTKEGRAWRDAVPAGLEIVTAAEMRTAARQAMALRAVPEIAALLDDGAAEQSFFWLDATTGAACKGRADWVYRTEAGFILLDLKTSEDASPAGFAKACARYSYHLQAAWYTDGWEAATGRPVIGFVFGVVESGWPHTAAAYMLDDEAMQRGRAECRRLLDLRAECLASGRWPGYTESITPIQLPAWA